MNKCESILKHTKHHKECSVLPYVTTLNVWIFAPDTHQDDYNQQLESSYNNMKPYDFVHSS